MAKNMSYSLWGWVTLSSVALAVCLSVPISAAGAGDSPSGDLSIYQANCASCHGPVLDGRFGPPLTGNAFKSKWQALGAAALAE
jgi:mono/diheme cytochrome c family protein